jgi:MFS family permease
VSEVSDQPFRLRSVALVAFGPSVVNSTGHGAVMPILALRARELGADVSTAALVVGLLGVGMLITSLPAGVVVARIGERRALLAAGLLDAAAMTGAALTPTVAGLAVAVLVSGMAWTTFLLSRQGFMIDAVPAAYRARAMSTLGGSHRVGLFVGPLLGAGLISAGGLPAAFWLAAGLAAGAAALAGLMPDLGSEHREEERVAGHVSVWTVIRAHRTVLLTLGTAVIVIAVSRSVRTSLLPLWADHIGLDASTTSLVFSLAALVDMVCFYPGGWVMDRFGRAPVAVPVVVAAALACLALPLTSGVTGFALVMALLAAGNGLGSGIVMTLGADAAPGRGRGQFLGAWRLCGDIGLTGGPLLISGVAAVAPLAAASVVVGVLLIGGTAWVAWWTSAVDRRVRARLSPR